MQKAATLHPFRSGRAAAVEGCGIAYCVLRLRYYFMVLVYALERCCAIVSFYLLRVRRYDDRARVHIELEVASGWDA